MYSLTKTPADTNIQSTISSKNSIIDANLDIIKAELESLRIKRYQNMSVFDVKQKVSSPQENLPISQRISGPQMAEVKLDKTSSIKLSPPFLKNESSRLQEIIDTFNNYEKNFSQTNHNTESSLLPTSPKVSSPSYHFFTNSSRINGKESVSKDIESKSNEALSKENVETQKPNLNGLIKYFSNNSTQQETFSTVRDKLSVGKNSPKKTSPVNYRPDSISEFNPTSN